MAYAYRTEAGSIIVFDGEFSALRVKNFWRNCPPVTGADSWDWEILPAHEANELCAEARTALSSSPERGK